jgi:hypothetical protein
MDFLKAGFLKLLTITGRWTHQWWLGKLAFCLKPLSTEVPPDSQTGWDGVTAECVFCFYNCPEVYIMVFSAFWIAPAWDFGGLQLPLLINR